MPNQMINSQTGQPGQAPRGSGFVNFMKYLDANRPYMQEQVQQATENIQGVMGAPTFATETLEGQQFDALRQLPHAGTVVSPRPLGADVPYVLSTPELQGQISAYESAYGDWEPLEYTAQMGALSPVLPGSRESRITEAQEGLGSYQDIIGQASESLSSPGMGIVGSRPGQTAGERTLDTALLGGDPGIGEYRELVRTGAEALPGIGDTSARLAALNEFWQY